MSRTMPPPHPTEFTNAVLDVMAQFIPAGSHVHDPFAGRGLRLGARCDRLGAWFTGTDIDAYREGDPRVKVGDSREEISYPFPPFIVATSPVYLNRMSTDYLEGPLPTTKLNGRRSYGICLGRALHPNNLARRCRTAESYYAGHADVVRHWSSLALVNVPEAMSAGWSSLLEGNGYRIAGVLDVTTPGYGYGANVRKGARTEVVIVARKGTP